MTTITELPESIAHLVGERVHGLDPAGIVVLLESGDDDLYAFPRTMTLARGSELVLDEKILLASLDRTGSSFWTQDEDLQRLRYNGSPRFGFGPYPDSERRADLVNAPDNSGRYSTSSTVIAQYSGTNGPASSEGFRVSVRGA